MGGVSGAEGESTAAVSLSRYCVQMKGCNGAYEVKIKQG